MTQGTERMPFKLNTPVEVKRWLPLEDMVEDVKFVVSSCWEL